MQIGSRNLPNQEYQATGEEKSFQKYFYKKVW
jgi:hypothetical protein